MAEFVELLADRFDRVERTIERLEWQMSRLEQRPQLWKRFLLTSGAIILVVAAAPVALGFRPTTSSVDRSSYPPPAVSGGIGRSAEIHSERHVVPPVHP
jgi:hypothetical protein